MVQGRGKKVVQIGASAEIARVKYRALELYRDTVRHNIRMLDFPARNRAGDLMQLTDKERKFRKFLERELRLINKALRTYENAKSRNTLPVDTTKN